MQAHAGQAEAGERRGSLVGYIEHVSNTPAKLKRVGGTVDLTLLAMWLLLGGQSRCWVAVALRDGRAMLHWVGSRH